MQSGSPTISMNFNEGDNKGRNYIWKITEGRLTNLPKAVVAHKDPFEITNVF